MESIGSSSINSEQSAFEIESAHQDKGKAVELIGTPKKLILHTEKVNGKEVFKLGFFHNGFLMCQSEFRKIIEDNQLGGLLFEENLAQMFPRK